MTTHPPTQIGRYRIERELGRGTMGVVYQAQDTTLGRMVALKTFGAMAAIAPHEREAFEQRFLSEARIAATIEDQNVVAVYDVGRDFETGLLFMALEFVRGETLAGVLSRGPMAWEEAVWIISRVARALQVAHSHHIVHRDIKPANIMLNGAGEPKIMDFGIAKASAAQLTIAGQVFGTPAYMSPEQAGGEEVDGRSDIFSLGAVLYELVTNARPFEGPTMASTLTRILQHEPRAASSLVNVPRDLDAVIGRALRKQRDARYDTAGHFADDLESLLEGKPPIHATQLGPLETMELPSALAAKKRASTVPKIVRTTPRPAEELTAVAPDKPAKNSLRVAGGVALGIALGVGVVLFFQQGSKGDGAPGPAAAPAKVAANQAVIPQPAAVTPAPIVTPPPVATPTAPVLSMAGSGGAAARVSLELKHPFASGSLRIKVDEKVVFVNRINGMPIRNQGVTTGYDGRFGTDLAISPGDHVIQVEIRSGDSEFIETSRVRLRSGETHRLVAFVDKALTLTFQ